IDIGRRVIGAQPLAMTIIATVRDINTTTAFGHSRFRRGIYVGKFLVHLRIEMSDLQIGNHGQAQPREGERAENPKKEWKQSFHRCASEPSASTGFKNVGTLAVRPRPKSIRPK